MEAESAKREKKVLGRESETEGRQKNERAPGGWGTETFPMGLQRKEVTVC